MRSLVMSVNLFMSAIASAFGEAFNYLANDPYLVWNYGVAGVLAAIGGIAFWFRYRKIDSEEDVLNNLPTGHLVTRREANMIDAERHESDSDFEKEKGHAAPVGGAKAEV